MSGKTLDIVSVTSVMSLGLTLRTVQHHQAGHVVADLSSGQTVQVGPRVLPPVAVGPLQARRHVRGLGLNIESDSIVRLGAWGSLTSVLIS